MDEADWPPQVYSLEQFVLRAAEIFPEDNIREQHKRNQIRTVGERSPSPRQIPQIEEVMQRRYQSLYSFLLCGKAIVDEGNQHQHCAHIDVMQNSLSAQHASRITATRDYDSVLGWSDELAYNMPLTVWPVPPFNETLTRDVHLSYTTIINNRVCHGLN